MHSVLIVDDAVENIDILSGILKDEYDVKIALNGEMAIHIAKRMKPDIILLDIMMPGMDGYETCRILKSDTSTKDIPVIFISTRDQETDEIKGFEAGAVDYISKPISALITKARIKTYLKIKEQNQELKQINQRLSEAIENKDRFLGMAAHDLRNPLAVIMGASEVMIHKSQYQQYDEIVVTMFKRIQNSSKFMLNLVNDLLDYSAIESGHLTLNTEKTDLILMIQEILVVQREFAKEKKIEILFDYDNNQSFFAEIDKHKFEQVIINLISNAIKYSNLNTQIEVSLAYMNQSVLILKIKDQGLGIPENEQHKLFVPFSITSVKSTAGEKSIGLGLLIVKKIIESHHGKIYFESHQGMGSCFFVKIPAYISQ